MDERKDTAPQGLFDVDIDAVAAEGKKQNKQNKKRMVIAAIVAAVLALLAAIIFMIVQQAKKEVAYQSAIKAIDNEAYEEAISTLRDLEDFKDSAEQLQRAESMKQQADFMKEFTQSKAYNGIMKLCEGHTVVFDYSEMRFVVDVNLDTPVKAGDTMTIEELKQWKKSTGNADHLCKQILSVKRRTGSAFSATVNVTDGKSKELLYQCMDEKSTYSKFDLEREEENTVGSIYAEMLLHEGKGEYDLVCESWDKRSEGYFSREQYKEADACYKNAKEKLVEPIYQEVKALADVGQYKEACEYWDTHNESGKYQLTDSVALKDYYNYSSALSSYLGKESFSPGALATIKEKLHGVSSNFKDRTTYYEEVSNIVDTVLGTYQYKVNTKGNTSWGTNQFITIAEERAEYAFVEGEGLLYTPFSGGDKWYISTTRHEYKPVCSVKNGELQQINLMDNSTGERAYVLTIEGRKLTATGSDGKSFTYEKWY